jgi:hypothetical protein
MRTSHDLLQQARLDLKRHLTTHTTHGPTTTCAFILKIVENHVAYLGPHADQFLTAHYLYVLLVTFITMAAFFAQWALWEKMTFVRFYNASLLGTKTDGSSVLGSQSYDAD